LLTLHHIVSDGWSQSILLRELSVLYRALLQHQPSSLPELPIQYADYALWQRQWLQGEVLQQQLSYWREQLQGVPLLELPTDFPRPPVQTFQGARHSFVLPQPLSEHLKTFSQQQGATFFMTLLAAFAVLLGRYSGQEDFAIGSPIAHRTHVEVEPLIGFFVNTLVLRVDLSGHPTFLDLLAHLRQVTLEAYAHQDLPFEMLVQELSPQRMVSHTPLFQVLFMLQNAPHSLLNLPGISVQPLEAASRTAKFDLALSLMETEQGLHGLVEYRTDLFEPMRIQRLTGHYCTLLEGIVAHSHVPVADLPLLTAEEQQLLLCEQAISHHDSQDGCVHHLFAEQVARTPEAIALVWQQQHLSYHELDQRAEQLAKWLRSQGIGPEAIVGVALHRCPDLLIAFLGILKAGGAYLPLDPASPPQRLSFILNEACVALVLTARELLASLPPLNGKVLCLDTPWTQEDLPSATRTLTEARAANLAYVIYTSGSTGQPKGALISHQGLCNLVMAQRQLFACQGGDRILQSAALSFDASIWEMVLALMAGATLYLPPPEVLLPGTAFTMLLDEQAITTLTLVPSLLAHLPVASLPHLRMLISAGEACPPSLLARWAAQRQFFNAYGPTEATICATVALCHQQMDWLPMGQPLEHVQVYLLDARMHLVPRGTIGELYLGGDSLARGYLQRPEMTAACFVPHPFSTRAGARLYRTGDLARYRTDGTLEFVGRRDQQVKWHGYRVELGEIESVLREAEGVREVVVQLVEDGREDKRLVAYIVAEAEADLPTSKLRSYVQAHLPGYMVPSAFVQLPSFPLTPSGKIDREVLPMPDQYKASDDAFEAPRTQVEQTIARIWQETLHVQQVSVHDNFFDLGGHSLILVQVQERVREVFARDISLLDLFTYPTISALAEHLQQKQREKLSLEQSYTRAEIRQVSRQRRRQIAQSTPLSPRTQVGREERQVTSDEQ